MTIWINEQINQSSKDESLQVTGSCVRKELQFPTADLLEESLGGVIVLHVLIQPGHVCLQGVSVVPEQDRVPEHVLAPLLAVLAQVILHQTGQLVRHHAVVLAAVQTVSAGPGDILRAGV